MTQPAPTTDAGSILVDAANTLTERGEQRDRPTGERSMARAVNAFNALYGVQLTELQGWQFMVLLKMSRSSASHVLRVDDYIDQAGYAALAGECAANDPVRAAAAESIDVVQHLRAQSHVIAKGHEL
jgi:hypothetical protein